MLNTFLPPIPNWPILQFIPAPLFWPLAIIVMVIILGLLARGASKLAKDASAGILIFFLAVIFIIGAVFVLGNMGAIVRFINRIFGPII